MNAAKKSVVVVGGNGAMGQAIIRAFEGVGWGALSVDLANTSSDPKQRLVQVRMPRVDTDEQFPSLMKSMQMWPAQWQGVAGGVMKNLRVRSRSSSSLPLDLELSSISLL